MYYVSNENREYIGRDGRLTDRDNAFAFKSESGARIDARKAAESRGECFGVIYDDAGPDEYVVVIIDPETTAGN